MPSLSLAKKTIAAAALIAPLSMSMVACSSNGDDAEGSMTSTSTSASTTTSTETSTSTTSSSTESEEMPKPEGTSSGKEPAPAPAQEQEAAAAVAAAAAALPSPKPAAPVEGGRPATPEETQEIESLARSVAWGPTLKSYLGGILDNTCRSVLQAQGGREAFDLNQIPDIPMEAIPELQGRKAEVQSVKDVKVDGNTASATVTTATGGHVESGTMRFLKEDGAWKLCD
ncbi:hypothetical protein [Corynebacterium sp. CCM 9204]|uniref:hypothetical protein n=1 Tax=Corynebacterium sp. CCM 9204 TaxID=3057616 RepID=UPI003525727A